MAPAAVTFDSNKKSGRPKEAAADLVLPNRQVWELEQVNPWRVLTVELNHAASVEIVRLDDNLERSVFGIRLDRRLDRHPRRRHGY